MSKIKEKDLLERLEEWRNVAQIKLANLWTKKDDRAYKRIVEFIKTFFAKEISSGPIKEDISRPVLIQWLQGINQAATAVHDDYVMKATTQLIAMLQEPEVTEELLNILEAAFSHLLKDINYKETRTKYERAKEEIVALIRETEKAKLIWDATCPGMDTGWLPTAENINALPEPVRNYIAGLETNADPPSMVADNIIMKDTIKTLEKMLEERPAKKVTVKRQLIKKYAEFFREDYERGFCSRNNYKGRLIRFAQEAGLEIVER